MKKLVLFAAVLVAVSFASCGGNKQAAPAEAAVETAAPAEGEKPCCEGDTAKSCCQGDTVKACCQGDTVKACCKGDSAAQKAADCCAEK